MDRILARHDPIGPEKASRRVWCSLGRVLIGAACGAAFGYVLVFVVLSPNEPDRDRGVVAFMGILAFVGAIAAAVLSAEGWTLLAGGLAGAVVMAFLGVLGTLHRKGAMYSLVGAPLGILFAFVYLLSGTVSKPPGKSEAATVRSDLWDGELDR